jgi:L-ascorbate metabolism protein UlaG (beta-lactamase superfamily)
MTFGKSFFAAALATAALWSFAASAQGVVKVTPLGGKEGEFCRYDRAMIFEDPDGTRILYDAGRTVAGADDLRLGSIDAVLISHMHGDHLGDRRLSAVDAGSCGEPDISVQTTPNSNSVEIAVAKGAKIVVGSEMQSFLAGKMKAAGGDPKDSLLVRFGASRQIGGVAITTVPAAHSNGVSPAFIGGELGEHMAAAGLNAYVGPPTGYVLTFSNGLAVYLSGDTGITAEQDSVVRGFYGAKLAVINIGDVFTTGPMEAVYVVDNLVQATSVIPSHANEVATEGGKVLAGTRTETFMNGVEAAAYLPLSGRTLAFDADGVCVEGC